LIFGAARSQVRPCSSIHSVAERFELRLMAFLGQPGDDLLGFLEFSASSALANSPPMRLLIS
jgi:hypothetical protein